MAESGVGWAFVLGFSIGWLAGWGVRRQERHTAQYRRVAAQRHGWAITNKGYWLGT